MDRARRHEDVDPMPLRPFDGRMDFLDVIRVTAGEAADNGTEILVRDRLYGLEVAGRGSRKTGFDNVHVQFGQFLPQRHAAAGCLFPVAQRRVENANSLS